MPVIDLLAQYFNSALQSLALERFRYDQSHMIRFERFRYKVISPFFHCFDGSFDRAVRGNHNNSNIVFPAPNFSKHINAIHVGHLDVEKNQLRILPFQKLQTCFSRFSSQYTIAQGLKTIPQHFAYIGVVINDKDVTGKNFHAILPEYR